MVCEDDGVASVVCEGDGANSVVFEDDGVASERFSRPAATVMLGRWPKPADRRCGEGEGLGRDVSEIMKCMGSE